MAKKKADVKEPEYSYDEIHNTDYEKLAEPVDEKIPDEEPKKEEEKDDEPKKDEDEEIEFDPEKLKEEAVEMARQKIWEEADKKQEEAAKELELAEKAKDENTPPWVKRGEETPKDYNELAEWNAEVAERKIMAKLEEREADKQAKIEAEKKAEEDKLKTDEERTKAFNDAIDEELTELYENNKLPKIVNKEDKEDPGIKARQALFQTMYDVNEKRKAEGKPLIFSINRIFNNYYKAPTAQPAGADAPIAGGRLKAASAKVEGEYSYNEIHNARDFRDLYK